MSDFKIFYEKPLVDYLREHDYKIRDYIKKESDEYILNISEDEYLNYLMDKFQINPPIFNFDDITVDPIEKLPSNNYYSSNFRERREKETFFVYHLPFEGKGDLLIYRPNPHIMDYFKVFINNNCLCFEIEYFGGDAEEINRTKNDYISKLKKQHSNFLNQIDTYNKELFRKIKSSFDARKEKALKKHNTIASLDVPIRKKNNLPETFAIPNLEIRKLITIKPETTETKYNPEPTLEKSVYYDILKTIHDFGKEFERLPATYIDKSEEQLRDHILLYLEPRFEGSATGETFNKSGKTDILLRYENSNVFIAECKFWKGKKSFLDAISQLIGYLTWRDSKAAVIIFVKNKEISNVLETVKKSISEHKNYLDHVNDERESWFNYRFHINEDKNREVKLAVLLFHFPD